MAARFGEEEKAEQIIEHEERELNEALEFFRPLFEGKKVFISAGEFRALATARLLEELGFTISGIRSFHHDEFAEVEYQKLANSSKDDFVIDIANVQPFEEANLLKRLKRTCSWGMPTATAPPPSWAFPPMSSTTPAWPTSAIKGSTRSPAACTASL